MGYQKHALPPQYAEAFPSYTGNNVPMFTYTADPAATKHSPSSGKYTIAAEPPTASCAFATKSIVTVFVIEPAIGLVARTVSSA